MKNELKEQLETLKIKPAEGSNTAFYFKGRCGNLHLIETNVDQNIGMKSGQILRLPLCRDCHSCDYNAIFIGTGIGCDHHKDPDFNRDETNLLWFLKEGDSGVSYFGDLKTLEEIRQHYGEIKLLS